LLCALVGIISLLYQALLFLDVYPGNIALPFHGRMSFEAVTGIVFLALSTGLRARLHIPSIVFLTRFLLIILNSVAGLSLGVVRFGGDLASMTLLSFCLAAIFAVLVNANHPFVQVILLSSEVGARTCVMATVGILVPWAASLFLYCVWGRL